MDDRIMCGDALSIMRKAGLSTQKACEQLADWCRSGKVIALGLRCLIHGDNDAAGLNLDLERVSYGFWGDVRTVPIDGEGNGCSESYGDGIDEQYTLVSWSEGSFVVKSFIEVDQTNPLWRAIGFTGKFWSLEQFEQVRFDRTALLSCINKLKDGEELPVVSNIEIREWVSQNGGQYNTHTAWPAFQKEVGEHRAGLRKCFDPIYSEIWPRPRGAPRKRAK